MDSEAMLGGKRHYAIGKKAKLFKRFDAGDRPSDVDDASVTRKTLYQYFGEWRKERGIPGRRTGFAIKRFNRKAYLKAKEKERRSKQREGILRLVSDWEGILEALEKWDGDFNGASGKIYLRGHRDYKWFKRVLGQKRERGIIVPMTKEENLFLYGKWLEIGNKARDKAHFERLCHKEGVLPPSGLDHIEES
jgi:hypothetical protein